MRLTDFDEVLHSLLSESVFHSCCPLDFGQRAALKDPGNGSHTLQAPISDTSI